MKLTQLILEGISYKVPNFDYEWEEAVRYPEFKKLGKHDWIDLATKGREVTITSAKDINNTDANNPKAFNSLNKDKRERTLAQIQSGTVEMPIVAKYPDGYKELLGGNTRLTALMAKNGKATIWIFDVPEDILDENSADDKAGLIQQFRQEVGTKQCSIYDKRDNCGPAALDFISWAKSKGIKDLKRIDGYFKADIPVSSKKDFTREMKREFLNDGGDWNNAKERFEWISNSKYAEQWKYIPHYWVEDSNGKIYDPTGQQQFIDAGYAKDLNPDRYVLTDIVENYADGKVKDQLRKYIDDYTEIDVDLLKKLLKDKKQYPEELDPRTGGNKYAYRGMTFKKQFIDKLKPIRTSNGVTEYQAPNNIKINSRSNKGYLSFTVDEEVAKGFGHYSGYVDHRKKAERVGGYVRVSLDNPNFILHPSFTAELSKDLEYSKESEKETLLIGSSFTPDKIYVVDENLYKENFKDGKKKGKSRPGRVKRSGASCKGSVSSLRAKAKKYGGEKGKMYHWCANMKGGKKK